MSISSELTPGPACSTLVYPVNSRLPIYRANIYTVVNGVRVSVSLLDVTRYTVARVGVLEFIAESYILKK